MQCKIIKNFAFSNDGIRVEQANAGSVVTIKDILVPGLRAAGYVAIVPSADALSPQEPAVNMPNPPAKIMAGSKPWEKEKVVFSVPENKMMPSTLENKEQIYEACQVSVGWFTIFSNGEEVKGLKKLRQDDAKAFNALSIKERAEYIEAELKKK
jgi:hypothetical protein